ncbi:MAG: hypothetical protein ACI4LM_01350, partial [Anaerovoracaceae bacterium]
MEAKNEEVNIKKDDGLTFGHLMKIIVFVLIAALIMGYLNSVFCLRDDNEAEGVFGTFYDLSDQGCRLDGVYIGSSATFRYFIPTECYRKHGACIYNLATASQPYFLYKNIIKEAVREQPDMKVIILELRPFTWNKWTSGEGSIRKVTDSMTPSLNWKNTVDNAIYYGNKLNKGSFEDNKLYYYL